MIRRIPLIHRIASPSQWTVRARTTVAATAVVTLCLVIAGCALLFVLYRTLHLSARETAAARANQVADQLRAEPADAVDQSTLVSDSQVGAVQVVDRHGSIVAASPGSPRTPLWPQAIAPGAQAYLSRVVVTDDQDFWVTGVGVQTPAGPVTVLVGADREPVEKVVSTVAGMLAVAGPIVVALTALGTHRLVGSALQPVERIRARVSSVTSAKLDERIPVPAADDEVARLAVTMNEMLDRLQAGEAAQQRFVSDASHELRSPLATITAALELAHHRPEMLDHCLIDESLLPEAHRMQRLVADLLLLARADERSALRHVVDVDLDDIMTAEAERVTRITTLVVTTDISHVRISGDPRALSRLVRNLVDNATRHAHRTLGLECGRRDDGAYLVVADDGPGVPEADRDRVFDRFVRLDSPRTRESGGAGLGLAIVAQIAAAHHGRVTIGESDSGGACFVVTLPNSRLPNSRLPNSSLPNSRLPNSSLSSVVDQPIPDPAHRLDPVTDPR